MKYTAYYYSPLGLICLQEEDGFLVHLDFSDEVKEVISDNESRLLEQAKKELDEYFAKKRQAFSLPYKFKGSSFQEKVWLELTKIPYGQTISYQELAKRIASPQACRAVGGANNRNPLSLIIPCHRVIGKNGRLVGYGGGLWRKEALLALEAKLG